LAKDDPVGDAMTIRWDAAQVPVSDRVEALRDTLWRQVVRIEVDHHVEFDAIDTRLTFNRLGPLGLLSVHSTGATVRRTPKLVKDDVERALFLGIQLSGTSVVVQDGKQAVLEAGDFAIYDTSVPYTLLFDGGVDQHYIRFPRTELALPDAAITTACAVPFGRDSEVARLASTFFAGVVERKELGDDVAGDALARPTVELLRAVIGTRLGDADLSRDPLDETLVVRIVEYLRAHLAAYDLSASRIAHAHNVSVRHLYAVLAKAGISLGDWIRSHRLEECRKDLVDPALQGATISSIARSRGFVDAAHFSRVFREAYGLTPTEWRQLRL
jgi:AraC-like DNA-binding protein